MKINRKICLFVLLFSVIILTTSVISATELNDTDYCEDNDITYKQIEKPSNIDEKVETRPNNEKSINESLSGNDYEGLPLIKDNKSKLGASQTTVTLQTPTVLTAGETSYIKVNVKTSNVAVTDGRVSITFNNKWIGSPGVSNGLATMNYAVPSTYNGNYPIKMTYINTNNEEITSSSNTISVIKPTNKITMSIPSSAFADSKIKLNASVTDLNGNKVNTGRVSITFNNKWIGSPGVNKGIASMDYTIPSTYNGNYPIKMTYINTNNQEITSTTKNISITKANNKITLNVPSTAFAGTQVKLNATVTDLNGNKVNTGRVSITFNNKWIGSPGVNKGIATMNYAVPSTYNGKYTVKMTYINSANQEVISSTKNISISKVSDKITVSVPQTTYVESQITITTTVTDKNNIKVNTGRVSLTFNNKWIGSPSIKNGVATMKYTIPNSYKGNYALKASYINSNNITTVTTTKTINVINNIIYVNPNGNDNTATGTTSKPYKTINAAVSKADNNYKIRLMGGTYTNNNLPSSLYIDKNINITNYNNNVVRLTLTTTDTKFMIGSTVNFNGINFINSRNRLFENYGILTITNCNFTGNENRNDGPDEDDYIDPILTTGDSIIYNYNKMSVSNSIFKNNLGKGYGGVIRAIDSTLTITSTTFDGNWGFNTVNGGSSNGGSLCLKDSTTTITNSKFLNNNAKQVGGAIFIAGGTTTITKSNFNNNTGMLGGVLYIRDNDGIATVKIYNSNFVNNTAYKEGGVIYNTAKLEINNSLFKYNVAQLGNGGAIVNNEGNMIIKSSNITSNKVESYTGTNFDPFAYDYGNGGGIFQKSGTSTISNSIINHNYGYNGGAITIEQGEINLINDKINDNNASYGGAISKTTNMDDYYDEGNYDYDSNEEPYSYLDNYKININNCSFNNNYAKIEASVIYNGFGLDSGGNITITNSIFNNNKLTKETDETLGMIIENSGYISLKNSKIINHKGSSTLIGSWGELDFKDMLFKDNNVKSIISSVTKATVTGNTFQSNTVTTAVIESHEGQGPGLCTITKSNFISNKGYAIYFDHYSAPDNMKIENNYWGSANPSWSSLLRDISIPKTYSKTKF